MTSLKTAVKESSKYDTRDKNLSILLQTVLIIAGPGVTI